MELTRDAVEYQAISTPHLPDGASPVRPGDGDNFQAGKAA